MLTVQPELWLTANVRPAMLRVPLRAGPVVGATENSTVPSPVRLPPPGMVIHGSPLAAVQSHSETVDTATVAEPPVCGTAYESGLMLKLQPELWFTTNVRPAMLTVPRRAGPVLGATVMSTEPFPLRLPPLETVIHGRLLLAVHSQPATVVTASVAEPPVCATAYDSGLTLKPQPLPCLTVNT
jgi:hypothetical protein